MNNMFSFGPMLALCMIASTSAYTAQCPATDRNGIADILDTAPTCYQSYALFMACSAGTSVDVGLSEIVTRKCEGAFLKKLTTAGRQAYNKQMSQCGAKYKNEFGTMYLSFAASCRANVARHYASSSDGGSRGKRR
jgi:hypothetical protein